MDLAQPLAVVTPTVDGGVLRVLAGADADFTASGVHALLPQYGKRGIDKVLARLVAQGIVLRTHVGRPSLYRLNREHLAAESIIALAHQRESLLERLRSWCAQASIPPVFAAVFGSAARGDHTAASDIDLFFVQPHGSNDDAWQAQLDDLASQVHRWTGNDVRPVSYAEHYASQNHATDPVMVAVDREGIPLVGASTWRALRSNASAAR